LKDLQIQEIRDAAIETLKMTISTHETVRKFLLDAEDEKVLSWLVNKSQSNHNIACKKHQASTGEWFVQSEAFSRWINSSKSSLWLSGKAGSGKTILCSTVIEQVVVLSQSSRDFHCAYFYFDFQRKWNVDDMLRSVIGQLCRSTGELPPPLRQLYQECQTGKPPFTSSLLEIAVMLAGSVKRTFLILDALDECEGELENTELLQVLKRLITDSKVLSLFVTSRKEEYIERSLKPVVGQIYGLEENVIRSDIELYVRSMLNEDVDLRVLDEETKSEIERTLVHGSDGMYPPKSIFLKIKVSLGRMPDDDVKVLLE
jgi:NACHT domain